jgi:hypothetical protein
VTNPGPYRDERESLLAENRRLRLKLAESRRLRLWPGAAAIAALAGYGVGLVALSDWFHGPSALRYWIAVVVLVGSLAASVGFAIALVRGGRKRGDNDGSNEN